MWTTVVARRPGEVQVPYRYRRGFKKPCATPAHVRLTRRRGQQLKRRLDTSHVTTRRAEDPSYCTQLQSRARLRALLGGGGEGGSLLLVRREWGRAAVREVGRHADRIPRYEPLSAASHDPACRSRTLFCSSSPEVAKSGTPPLQFVIAPCLAKAGFAPVRPLKKSDLLRGLHFSFL